MLVELTLEALIKRSNITTILAVTPSHIAVMDLMQEHLSFKYTYRYRDHDELLGLRILPLIILSLLGRGELIIFLECFSIKLDESSLVVIQLEFTKDVYVDVVNAAIDEDVNTLLNEAVEKTFPILCLEN
ncbi:hypothetical protein ACJX0J_012471, partial [Zea mays]